MEGEDPNCLKCVKVVHKEIWLDERYMKAFLLFRLGVEADRISNDSWLYTAIQILRGHEDKKQTQKIERDSDRAMGKMQRSVPRKWR